MSIPQTMVAKMATTEKWLEDLALVEQPEKLASIDALIEASDKFEAEIHRFPTRSNVIAKKSDPIFLTYANDSYPVMHEKVLKLCQDFLVFKRKSGSTGEKELYREMTLVEFIDRLIRKVSIRWRLIENAALNCNF